MGAVASERVRGREAVAQRKQQQLGVDERRARRPRLGQGQSERRGGTWVRAGWVARMRAGAVWRAHGLHAATAARGGKRHGLARQERGQSAADICGLRRQARTEGKTRGNMGGLTSVA